jgi:carboxypeptidase PM20D1
MKRSRLFLLSACLLLAIASVQAGPASERLAAAVRFPTVSHQDPAQFEGEPFLALHAWLRESYPRVFNELEVELINDYSLLIVWPGVDGQRPPVLFTAHMDVVPVEPGTEAHWSHPPFAGVIENATIYGRGTLDDKVGVISLLEAAEALLASGYQPQRTLVFGFGHDEEVGGRGGARMIARRLREKQMHFDWMVDEGGLIAADSPLTPDRAVVMIGVAEKTYLTLVLTARGKGGHSSTPPAHTSIGRLAAAVVRVENNPFPAKLVEPVITMLERTAPHVDFPNNLVFSNLWLTGSMVADRMSQDSLTASFVRTTTALTVFNAGVKDNVIPQVAEARINFRLLPGDTPAMVIERVRQLVDDPEISVESAEEWADTPPLAAMEGGGFDIIAHAAQSVYPESVVVPWMLSATTDIRHYIDLADNHYRFHGNVVALAQASGIHGTDERLGVESFEKAVTVAEQMLQLSGQ